MKLNIDAARMRYLQFLFANAVEQGKYICDEFEKFLNDSITYGMVVMEKIVHGQVEGGDVSNMDKVIVMNKENMFSAN